MCSNNEYLKQNYGCISNTNTNTSELNFQNTNTNTNTPTLVFKYSINTNTLYLTPSLITTDVGTTIISTLGVDIKYLSGLNTHQRITDDSQSLKVEDSAVL